jgi:methylated-DNA-protein-cysteine methyltransferase-like protein
VKSFEAYDEIYAVVAAIPRGRVATYGQVAELAGLPRRARMVGYALRSLPDGSGVPWHRVVNTSGEISRRGRPDSERDQKTLLMAEGVEFNRLDRISLKVYLWDADPCGD